MWKTEIEHLLAQGHSWALCIVSEQSFYCNLNVSDPEHKSLTTLLPLQLLPTYQNKIPCPLIAIMGWLILFPFSYCGFLSKAYAEKLVEYFHCWLFLLQVLACPSSGSVALMLGHLCISFSDSEQKLLHKESSETSYRQFFTTSCEIMCPRYFTEARTLLTLKLIYNVSILFLYCSLFSYLCVSYMTMLIYVPYRNCNYHNSLDPY